ncbi:hypothetical protein AGR4C_pa60017 [Agrobacterium tumefaciens str. Kerr 14]|uniref:Uncharacterized protein n=1 Tax=Agrobacterium tumefaciens str. Kerr 14 TaxID=1183424 RepID=A0A1S7SCG0_AGRTU|nr:hypothetical protein [Agrobacterium tumefaciens]CUX65781.1 hypothetical protein AGR4C_pa60017 [Agrobacterium tumefaciens str. Kerr 14]
MARDHPDSESDALKRFVLLTRSAKLQRRLADGGSEVERQRASDSIETLVAFADECSALQSHRVPFGKQPPFAPELQERFDALETLLERHAGRGINALARRRTLLEKVALHATTDPAGEPDYAEIARTFNGRMRGGYVLRDTSSEQLPQRFSDRDARDLVDLVRARNQVVRENVRSLNTLFDDPGDDDTSMIRGRDMTEERSKIRNAVEELAGDVLSGIGEHQHKLLIGVGRRQAQSRDENHAAADESPASPGEHVIEGRKRKRSGPDFPENDGSGHVRKLPRNAGPRRREAPPTITVFEDGDNAGHTAISHDPVSPSSEGVQAENVVPPPIAPRPEPDQARQALIDLRASQRNTRSR